MVPRVCNLYIRVVSNTKFRTIPATALQQPLVDKTHRAAFGDDDVIVKRDIHPFGRVANGMGHLDIGLRRGGISRRVEANRVALKLSNLGW